MGEEKTITDIVINETPDDQLAGVMPEKLDFQSAMKLADMLSQSTIVPVQYQNRPENCFIAIDMSCRMQISPMVVMQNLFVIQGKPSWSGQACAMLIEHSGKYKDLELNYVGEEDSDNRGAYVSAVRVSTGERIKGTTVTVGTAKKEGWYSKNGSKWQTMPELMLAYRAYAWFARVRCPEALMGLQTVEEVEDVIETTGGTVENPYEE